MYDKINKIPETGVANLDKNINSFFNTNADKIFEIKKHMKNGDVSLQEGNKAIQQLTNYIDEYADLAPKMIAQAQYMKEAMKDGNETLREYEDGLKLERNNKMSVNEWKNNELNQLLLKKFGILKESVENIEELSAREEQSEDRLQSGEAEGREQGRLREEELEEAKGKYDDGDGKDEKCDYVDCKDNEEDDKKDVSESVEQLVKENRKLRLRIK